MGKLLVFNPAYYQSKKLEEYTELWRQLPFFNFLLQGKTSTKDLLEKITAQLKDIESFNRDTQAWQKKVIGTLIAYFSVLYFLAIIFAYYNYYNDAEWQDPQARLKLFLPFLVAPLM